MEAAVKEVQEIEAGQAAPRARKRPFMVLAAVGAVVAVGIGAFWIASWGKESTDDAQVEADVVPLAPRVSGQVMRVSVQENQPVKKGDAIMQLDDADYAARVDQAAAELETAQAQAQAADAQAGVTEAGAKGGFSSARAAVSGSSVAVANADAQIASAKASLARSKADAQKAQTDLKRTQELKAANAVPQEQLDNAQAADSAARAAVQQAEAQVAVAEESKRAARSRVDEAQGRLVASAPIDAQIAVARSQAALAHARVKSAEAQLTLAKLQLSYTKLVSPEDGFVSKLSAHEGQLLSPGQPVAELVPRAAYVVANFKETQIGEMRSGQKAEVSVDAFGRTLEGQVDSLSGGTGARFSLLPPDNATGNFVKVVQRVPVRIKLLNIPSGTELRAGLSVDVTVHVK
jgi:membrane fusion protein (multidrug efflux system)